MKIKKANEWSISYFSAFSIDSFVFEPFFSYIQVFLLRYSLYNDKLKIIKKILGDENIINYLL